MTLSEIKARAEQLFGIYFRLERANHCAHVTEFYHRLAFAR